MFQRDKAPKAPPPIIPATPKGPETVIGPNAHFRGDIQSDGNMRIDGIFEGNIDLAGNLVISETGKLIAEVTANNISISGAIKGNVSGNRVEITRTGRVWGNLTVKSLMVDEGAYFRGQTMMHGDIEPPMIEAPKPRQAAQPARPQPANAAVVDVEVKPKAEE